MAEAVYLGKASRGVFEFADELDPHCPYDQPTGASSGPGEERRRDDSITRTAVHSASPRRREGNAAKSARIKAAEVDRVNRILGRKLQDLKREPPSQFHAPNGYKSVKGGRARGMQRHSDMQGKQTSKPQQEWPPPVDDTQMMHRTARQREVTRENARLAGALEDKYQLRKDSFVVKNELGPGKDCRKQWQGRTEIYSAGAQRGPTLRPSQRPSSAAPPPVGVPKTLGVAHCSGCGAKSFFGADGKALQPCDYCQSAWYCSDTCAKIDWQHHKKMCKYKSGGEKCGTWSATDAPEDCWISNAAMRKGRQLLAQKTERYPDGNATRQITEEMRKVSMIEAEQIAIKREVEMRANYGMDGPRPCLQG